MTAQPHEHDNRVDPAPATPSDDEDEAAIDEADEESFPASDPPSRWAGEDRDIKKEMKPGSD